MTTIGLAIPSIPPRAELLARALNSVCSQERLPDAISVALDTAHDGAAVTRNRAWRALGSVDRIAFLDDDDELLPEHLSKLTACMDTTGADLVYSWFTVVGGVSPFPPEFATDPWNPADPRQTTVTVLWSRTALVSVGGFPEDECVGVDAMGGRAGEEFRAVCALNERGGKIVHLPEVTWLWHHHYAYPANTSGLPNRW